MSDKNIKNRYEQMLKNILEFGGAVFIMIIVIGFGILVSLRSCDKSKNDTTYIDTLHVSKIKYFEIVIFIRLFL